MSETVAIIPARGGSKGIPKKNTVEICGKPLVAWSIEQALEAEGIDSVWVSSDSDEILSVAECYGARSIKRPREISHDTASSEEAWLHALDTIEQTGHTPSRAVGIQATSPIRESRDFQEALRLFEQNGYDSLFTATEIADFHVWRRDDRQGHAPVNYDYRNRQMRQNIEKRYLENGSFYVFRPEIIRSCQNRLGGRIGVCVLEEHKMFQIDTPEDVRLCEVIMRGYGLVG